MAGYNIKVFESVLTLTLQQTDNIASLDVKTGCMVTRLCTFKNNVVCLKKLLLTGKVNESWYSLVDQTSSTITRVLSDYFGSPVETSLQWSKQLNSNRRPAATATTVQLICLKTCDTICDCITTTTMATTTTTVTGRERLW